MEMSAHVGSLLRARESGEGHRCSRNIAARVGQELVELLEAPLTALAFHGCRIVESCFGSARTVHNIPQVGADPVWSALLESVASLTLLGSSLTLFHGGLGKQDFDRLVRLFGRATLFSL